MNEVNSAKLDLDQGRGQNPDLAALICFLRSIEPLSAEVELSLSQHMKQVSVRKRKKLLKEGAICQHIYFVVKGAVRGVIYDRKKDITTWIMVENQFLPSMGDFDEKNPVIEYIQALENSELLAITLEDLDTLFKKHSETIILARKILQHHYAEVQRRAFVTRLNKAENRYRHFLIYYPELAYRIQLKYIASFLGTTLETLSRIRKKVVRSPPIPLHMSA